MKYVNISLFIVTFNIKIVKADVRLFKFLCGYTLKKNNNVIFNFKSHEIKTS